MPLFHGVQLTHYWKTSDPLDTIKDGSHNYSTTSFTHIIVGACSAPIEEHNTISIRGMP